VILSGNTALPPTAGGSGLRRGIKDRVRELPTAETRSETLRRTKTNEKNSAVRPETKQHSICCRFARWVHRVIARRETALLSNAEGEVQGLCVCGVSIFARSAGGGRKGRGSWFASSGLSNHRTNLGKRLLDRENPSEKGNGVILNVVEFGEGLVV